ncbi:membrane-associated protein, putative [Bodo saltans]|uniref:Membrane-associated protein, putative n=1 Tax=Bodo saltans TaxID=75058 RepID=A0A0S4JSV2_BODSA|nr:membrane-associated protein, putative [Bodo saltans]|eukprot:CUG92482.1 membrane-associated protein, putative [Bodo saltans]
MFRKTILRPGHAGIAAQRLETCLTDLPTNYIPFRRRVIRRVRSWPWWKKLLYPITAPFVAFGAYVGVCTFIHKQHRPVLDDMFDWNHADEYPMEEWSKVEPTLREGDIVLLMGTGSMSWKICNTAFVISRLKAGSIRYSHVGVVVQPAEMESRPLLFSRSGGSSKSAYKKEVIARASASHEPPKVLKGALMLEAVDNKDINCPDWQGNVRHDSVQVVEISKRAFGSQDDRPCYHRFAVRRLQGFEWTPDRRDQLRRFIDEHVGQTMDKSPKLMIAFMFPSLYDWLKVRTSNEISCSELIADLYKAVGVIQKRVQRAQVPNEAKTGGFTIAEVPFDHRRSLEISPAHFAEGLEKGVLDFAPGVGLGPEVRIPMVQPPKEKLYAA